MQRDELRRGALSLFAFATRYFLVQRNAEERETAKRNAPKSEAGSTYYTSPPSRSLAGAGLTPKSLAGRGFVNHAPVQMLFHATLLRRDHMPRLKFSLPDRRRGLLCMLREMMIRLG